MNAAIMVMGVSGCGKSTVGAALAKAMEGVFLDGDDYHPPENRAHMAAGQPLNDAMRWPWLDTLAAAVTAQRVARPTVFACSALKRSYRSYLGDRLPDLQIIYLQIAKDVVENRVRSRQDHFMPVSLVDSQFATLEVPTAPAIIVEAAWPVDVTVQTVMGRLP
ncbi:MAG: gluconokinase [Pseudomonadota bacterium]